MTVRIAVASGKGGVGKSTVALNLAVALAEAGLAVGLADLDIYGPDIPAMVGLTRRKPARSVEVWTAPDRGPQPKAVERFGVRLMSTQFLIGESQALSLRAGLADLLVHRIVDGIDWGEPDVLLLDLPPGTADLQRVVAQKVAPAGVIVVVTPQDVAHLDAKKVITMFRESKVEVLGGVENFAGLVCPCCGETVELYPRVEHSRSIWADGVTQMASVLMRPDMARAAELGVPWLVHDPTAAESATFRELATTLAARWLGEGV